MTLSVQIDPLLECRLEEEARRLGITPSDFVRELLEKTLGRESPADIYRRVCSFSPMGDPNASENVSEKIKAKLRANHPD